MSKEIAVIDKWAGLCGSCRYFEQGKSCSFCGNPWQGDKSYKEYLYYNFGCKLWVNGIAQSRVEYINSLNEIDSLY